MDRFNYNEMIIFGIWALFAIKFIYDQTRLFKAYQRDVDNEFKLSPYTENFTVRNPIALMTKRWEILFAHYPRHPEVDRLAKMVRIETIVFFILFIALGVALWF